MSDFFRRGLSEIHFCPTVSSLAAPSRAEVAAGTDLSPAIAEINGFNFSNSPIMTPKLSTTFTTQIPGEDTTDTSTLTFYDDDADDDMRSALVKGTEGVLVFMPYGDTPGLRAEVWPAISTGVNDQWTMSNEAAKFQVAFAITEAPEQDAVVPAAGS
jgi:hypothetical protein